MKRGIFISKYITKSYQSYWREKIRIADAITESGKICYLVDENYDFISPIKEYLDMLSARVAKVLAYNTFSNYCHLLWYFIVFLEMKGLKTLDVDGKPEILVHFKIWLKNPYRFYENIDIISNSNEIEYEDNNLSISTMNAIIDRVSSLFLWLTASNRIKDNPVVYRNVIASKAFRDRDLLAHTRHGRFIKINALKTKKPKTKTKVVSQKDFSCFLNNFSLLRDKIIFLILKEGGLRSGELLGIKLEDIDFGEQGIWIKFRTDNINNARAKSGYGRNRFVSLPVDLMLLIDKYISSEWLNSNSDTDFLFVVIGSTKSIEIGNAMKKSTLDSIFRYYSYKIFGYNEVNGKKIPTNHIHPHQLRHTHVTELVRLFIDKGEPVNWKFISERIGHSSITTSMETYAHLEKEDFKKEYLRLKDHRKQIQGGNTIEE